MNLLKLRPLAAALFVFFAGFFLLSNLSFLWRAILLGLSLCAGLILLFQKRKFPAAIASAFLLLLAASLMILSSDLPDHQIRARRDTVGQYECRAVEVLDEEKNVWLVGSVGDENGRLFCRLSADLPDDLSIEAGDRIAGEGTVVSLSAYARRGLYGRGCRGRLNLSGDVEIVGRSPDLRAPFTRLAKAVRETLSSRVKGENGGLLVAVLLGETEELPTGTELLFRRAGISHALAVSGMHLVFVAAALSFLLRRFGLPRPAVGILVVLFAFFYAALVGFTPSVLRASLMLAFYEGSWFARRQPDSLTSLALSGGLMLLFAPHLIFSVSFLLSYLATLGILFAAQFCRTRKPRRRPLPVSLARRIGSFALMTLFAVLFTLPVSCALFGEVSLLSIPSNLLLSLPIQALLYLALAVLVLPIPFLWDFAGRCCTLFLVLLRRVAEIPVSPLVFSSKLLNAAGALPLLALLAVGFLSLSKRKRIVLCSVAGAVTLAAFLILALPIRDGGVILLSDGKDNDLIVLRDGSRAACVDLGDPDGVLPLLEKELRADRIGEVDRYVFFRYGENTAESFSETLSQLYVRRVILSAPNESERGEYEALVSLLKRVSVDYTLSSEEREVFGYGLGVPQNGILSLTAGDDRLLYIEEELPIPREGFSVPDGTTVLFFGSHGETRLFSFEIDLPESVKAVYTGSDFYTTCAFFGGAPGLRKICAKRFVPDGFLP